MKWIKYQIVCNKVNEEVILLDKKLGYNEANLKTAKVEAYNGVYTIEEDDSPETNILSPDDFLLLDGGTMNGPLLLSDIDLTEDLCAVPKKYVDEATGELKTSIVASEDVELLVSKTLGNLSSAYIISTEALKEVIIEINVAYCPFLCIKLRHGNEYASLIMSYGSENENYPLYHTIRVHIERRGKFWVPNCYGFASNSSSLTPSSSLMFLSGVYASGKPFSGIQITSSTGEVFDGGNIAIYGVKANEE